MDWRHRSACLDEDPELFFPIGNTGPAILQIEEAKQVCRRCDVREQCLAWALEAGQDHGVWGGLSEDERRALKRRNARARVRTRLTDPRPADGSARLTRHVRHLYDDQGAALPDVAATQDDLPAELDSTSVRTMDRPRLADVVRVEVRRQADAVVGDRQPQAGRRSRATATSTGRRGPRRRRARGRSAAAR